MPQSVLPWPVFIAWFGAALLLMACVFLLIMFIGVSLSGWKGLAQHYATRRASPNYVLTLTTAYLGIIPFNMGPLFQVGADREGLFLAMRFLHWIGYAPLFVPWEEISLDISRPWLTSQMEFSFHQSPHAVLRIASATGRSLIQAFAPIHLSQPQRS